jgi:hypothetical protein
MRRPRLVGGERGESYALHALAGALLLAGPVWLYLYRARYPVGTDVLLLVGAAAITGALAALLVHRIGGLVGAIGFGVLVYVFVDLQFDLHRYLRAPLLLGLTIALALLLRRHRAAITCITLGTLFAAALPRADPSPSDAPAGHDAVAAGRAGLPVLVHVILDEQWGIGGLRLEGDTATASFLTDFYLQRGFEVYPAAYSHYAWTRESLPALVSLGKRPPDALVRALRAGRDDPDLRFEFRVQENPYFELLRARGYVVHVIQSDVMDFCAAPAAPVASCETRSGNTIANIANVGGSALTRAMVVGRFFLSAESYLYRRLNPEGESWRRSSVGGGLRGLRDLRLAIERGPHGGVAYFVHVLVPHRPIEVDSACHELEGPGQRIGYYQPPRLSDSAWAARLALTGGQIRCGHRMLEAVLDALDRTVGRDGAIVVVHGDHGGRVFQHDASGIPLSRLDARQLSGYYSTLLAVRRPGVPPRVVSEPVPVQEFVWRLAGQDFRGPVAPDFRHYVLASHPDSAGTDTMRPLWAGAMPWER